MCQYSGEDGNPSKWHYGHLQQLSFSGAGMIMIEATAVSDQGRITLKDLTLKNEENENSFKKLINYIKSLSDVPLGLQISHAGRKGSTHVPWVKQNSPLKVCEQAWETVAPSPIKRGKHWPTPVSLTHNQMTEIASDYIQTTFRANRIGFDCLEIHMAHGYLLHQFFSPITNLRTDFYGGTLNNRSRFPLELVAEVRKIWPSDKILGVRITGEDWINGGVSINDSSWFAGRLKDHGVDYVCVSSGGIIPKTGMIIKPGYQVQLAEEIKKRTGIITRTSGSINSLNHATNILNDKSADLVAFGKKFINEPTWLIHEILKNGINIQLPNQYKRCYEIS